MSYYLSTNPNPEFRCALNLHWYYTFSTGVTLFGTMLHFVCTAVMKILCGNFEKSFLECLQCDLPALPPCKCFQVYIISKVNCTVFLVQFQLFEELTCANELQIELETI